METVSDELHRQKIGRAAPAVDGLQSAAMINGIHTEVLFSDFTNKSLIIITQYEKMGGLILVTNDNPEAEKSNNISTRILLGPDEPLVHVIAKKLVSKYALHKPVLLSLALKDKSLPVVEGISEILDKLMDQR